MRQIPKVLMGGLLLVVVGLAQASPEVTVDTGKLAGVSRDGVDIFKGIPYAAPPVGELRWEPPAPAAEWQGTRDASAFGPICPQPARPDGKRAAGYGSAQSEDCLYLNVWAPAHAKHAPVMVWIHGGAFRFGSGESPLYDGTAFAKDGVVLVTLNYRLGLLGFFAHPALTSEAQPGAPLGNYGLMDQMAALRWVQNNIASFGGDPGNVTVFGESAGGSSILYLFAAPTAQGLFAKAIVESGGGWNKPKTLAEMEREGAAFATKEGLPGAKATLAELQAIPVDQMFHTSMKLGGVGPFEDGGLVTETPAQAFADGHAFDVPLIIGSNSNEASLMRAFGISPKTMTSRLTPAERKIYAPDDSSETRLADAIFTDAVMGAPAQWIAARASGGAAPSWLYHFSYVASMRRGRAPGASHGSEIVFAFGNLSALKARFPMLSISAQDRTMERLMHSCWVGFAKTGKPDCDGIQWPAFKPATDELMEFGVKPHVVSHFREKQYRLLQRVLLPGAGVR